MKNDFIKIMNFRYACKVFDDKKKISDPDMRYILDMGILSPSSFGMEPWKFLVITNQKLKEKLRVFCWDQAQITSCSHLVIILAKIQDIKPSSIQVKTKFERRGLPPEKTQAYIQRYTEFLSPILDNDKLFEWSSKQTYIALANMMNAGASIGIDSCPIEGFERENIEKLLDIDISHYRVSVLVPFGYRLHTQPQRLRDDFDELVKFI
jgi:nitroreductase